LTVVAFTGHRPDKLGSYTLPNPAYLYVCRELERILKELGPEKAISGMAQGFDLYAANVCINLGIPFIAAVPFIGQENIWPEKSKRQYHALLEKAAEVHVVCEGGYAAWKLQKRNEWMTLNSNIVISCWDGSPGGTKNCVDFCSKIGRERINIDPRKAMEEK